MFVTNLHKTISFFLNISQLITILNNMTHEPPY